MHFLVDNQKHRQYLDRMAKLNDAYEWLRLTIGDDGRANSLIKRGRDYGLFTKGKRGGSAPDLQMDDFARLALMTLTDTPPTKIVEGLRQLADLPLQIVQIRGDAVTPVQRTLDGPWSREQMLALEEFGLSDILAQESSDKRVNMLDSIKAFLTFYSGRFGLSYGDSICIERAGGEFEGSISLNADDVQLGSSEKRGFLHVSLMFGAVALEQFEGHSHINATSQLNRSYVRAEWQLENIPLSRLAYMASSEFKSQTSVPTREDAELDT